MEYGYDKSENKGIMRRTAREAGTEAKTRTETAIDRLFDKIDVTKYPLKKMIAIPLIILLIAITVIAYTQITVGTPVHLGIDFEGGILVKIITEETEEELAAKFDGFPLLSIRDTGVIDQKSIEFEQMSKEQKNELIALLKEDYERYELKHISPFFGAKAQEQAVQAVILAFILLAIVVFVVFRTVIPPLAVVFAALSNIVISVAGMNIIGMELSLGTVAALLMLIGYSVDSNILLSTKVLRRKGDIKEKVRNAMKTGVTMTFTTISAIFAMFLVSSYIHLFGLGLAPIPILRDISLVLLIGLTMDLLNTWLLNAGILRGYVEKKEQMKYGRGGVVKGKGAVAGNRKKNREN